MSRRYRERNNKKIHLTINTRILPGADRTRVAKKQRLLPSGRILHCGVMHNTLTSMVYNLTLSFNSFIC